MPGIIEIWIDADSTEGELNAAVIGVSGSFRMEFLENVNTDRSNLCEALADYKGFESVKDRPIIAANIEEHWIDPERDEYGRAYAPGYWEVTIKSLWANLAVPPTIDPAADQQQD